MWGTILPLLLATPSPPSTIVSPAGRLIQDVRSLYTDLSTQTVGRNYSPTIRFSFVSPPIDASSTWRDHHVHPALRPAHGDDDTSLYETVASTHGRTKPLALYLPGLDGVGISATTQFDDLANSFEFWRLTVSTSDRSSFGSLTDAVASFVHEAAVKLDREVVLIGESFGGLLAPSVAMRVNAQVKRVGGDDAASPIKGLVLVNPATSFDDTQWSTFAPLLSTLRHLEEEVDEEKGGSGSASRRFPTPYSVLGGLTLATSIPDSNQFRRIVSTLTDIPVTDTEDLTEVLSAMRDGFGILEDQLPADVLEHRVGRWLPVGASVVIPRLPSLAVPTFVIAGQEDNMLPTQKEAERLVKVMPNCTKMDVRGSGHFVLDDRVNLTKAILESNIDPLDRASEQSFDPITDWKLPDDDVIKETIDNNVKPLRTLTSPVFFSTGKDGRRRMGLSQIPKADEGPVLFVANHQFGGLDLGMIVAQLIEDRNIAARGLAHPILFQGGPNGNGQRDPFAGGGEQPNGFNNPSLFRKFGAVMVTPRNYYRLMQTGQTAMLFPGGVREVFHGKDEAYQLFWPEKVDFVRTAAKFNATVIPLSAVGAADSVNILVDAPDLLKLPFGIGERAANNSASVISARFDTPDESELFQPPFALPKLLPARHYFVFGKPMETNDLDHRDMDGCEMFYEEVKMEMQRGFDDILQARDKDPFSDTARRIAFEQVTGRKAPTFSLDELGR